jgi:hypothetical protein
MWRCSGRHWINATIVWTVFSFAFFVAVAAGGESAGLANGENAIVHLDVRTVEELPRPSVVLNISSLDLDALESAAFGDNQDELPAK